MFTFYFVIIDIEIVFYRVGTAIFKDGIKSDSIANVLKTRICKRQTRV